MVGKVTGSWSPWQSIYVIDRSWIFNCPVAVTIHSSVFDFCIQLINILDEMNNQNSALIPLTFSPIECHPRIRCPLVSISKRWDLTTHLKHYHMGTGARACRRLDSTDGPAEDFVLQPGLDFMLYGESMGLGNIWASLATTVLGFNHGKAHKRGTLLPLLPRVASVGARQKRATRERSWPRKRWVEQCEKLSKLPRKRHGNLPAKNKIFILIINAILVKRKGVLSL